MHPFLDLPPSLDDAILSLSPTAYWPLDDSGSPLRDAVNRYPATVTGSPTYGVAAPSPIERGVTFSGTGQYALTSGSVPTPITALSVLAFFRTTNATAAVRNIISRTGAANQSSWQVYLGGAHAFVFQVNQSTAAAHASANSGGAANDGLWHLALGTFDGTTVTAARDGNAAVSSTSLTGSWHSASTGAVAIAGNSAGTSLYPGDVAHLAIFNRKVSDAERLWIYSVAKGS